MAGQRPRISIFNDLSSNNVIRRQQQEWDRVNTPLTPQESDYITKATGGVLGRPETIGDAERINAVLKSFAPPPSKYGKVWNPTNKQYEQGELKPGTPLEPPVEEKDEYLTTEGPLGKHLVKKQKGVDYSGLTVGYEKPPPHYLDRTDKYGRVYQVEEGTGKRTSPENPPPDKADRVDPKEKAKKENIDQIIAQRERVNSQIQQYTVRLKSDEKPSVNADINKSISDLETQRDRMDKRLAELGYDIRNIGGDADRIDRMRDKATFQKLAAQPSDEDDPDADAAGEEGGNEPGSDTGGGFGGGKKEEAVQAEDMSGVGQGDANVNAQKQRQLDADMNAKLSKLNPNPISGKTDQTTINGEIWRMDFNSGKWRKIKK